MASGDATPVPIKNQAYRVTFPILDNTGSLVTAAAGLDSEISKDAGTFADVTAEATEIATSSGMYYLDLTATEMNADTVAIIVKTTTTDAKTTPIVLYPQEAGDIPVDVETISTSATAADNLEAGALGVVSSTCASGSTSTNIVTNLSEATDDHYIGRVIVFISGALAGQALAITDYVGSTKALTVTNQTADAPANTDAFVIV